MFLLNVISYLKKNNNNKLTTEEVIKYLKMVWKDITFTMTVVKLETQRIAHEETLRMHFFVCLFFC